MTLLEIRKPFICEFFNWISLSKQMLRFKQTNKKKKRVLTSDVFDQIVHPSGTNNRHTKAQTDIHNW